MQFPNVIQHIKSQFLCLFLHKLNPNTSLRRETEEIASAAPPRLPHEHRLQSQCHHRQRRGIVLCRDRTEQDGRYEYYVHQSARRDTSPQRTHKLGCCALFRRYTFCRFKYSFSLLCSKPNPSVRHCSALPNKVTQRTLRLLFRNAPTTANPAHPAPMPSTRGRRAPLPIATNFLPDRPRPPGGSPSAAVQEAARRASPRLTVPSCGAPQGSPPSPGTPPSPAICTQVSGPTVEGVCFRSSSCSPAVLDAVLRVLFRAGGGLARRRASAQLFRFMAEAAAPLPWVRDGPLHRRRVAPCGARAARGGTGSSG